jgi:hypothetical protein
MQLATNSQNPQETRAELAGGQALQQTDHQEAAADIHPYMHKHAFMCIHFPTTKDTSPPSSQAHEKLPSVEKPLPAAAAALAAQEAGWTLPSPQLMQQQQVDGLPQLGCSQPQQDQQQVSAHSQMYCQLGLLRQKGGYGQSCRLLADWCVLCLEPLHCSDEGQVMALLTAASSSPAQATGHTAGWR